MPFDMDALMQKYRADQLQMPEMGSQFGAPAQAPTLGPVGQSPAQSGGGMSDVSVGELGKAGVQGALSLINNLYGASVKREVERRKADQERAGQTAKTTQDVFRQQQAGAVNPLRDLMAAYRPR